MDGDRTFSRSIREELCRLDLQLQVLEIIDEILSGTAPGETDARNSLRMHVDRNPGQPQRALLMHMLSVERSDHG